MGSLNTCLFYVPIPFKIIQLHNYQLLFFPGVCICELDFAVSNSAGV